MGFTSTPMDQEIVKVSIIRNKDGDWEIKAQQPKRKPMKWEYDPVEKLMTPGQLDDYIDKLRTIDRKLENDEELTSLETAALGCCVAGELIRLSRTPGNYWYHLHKAMYDAQTKATAAAAAEEPKPSQPETPQ